MSDHATAALRVHQHAMQRLLAAAEEIDTARRMLAVTGAPPSALDDLRDACERVERVVALLS